MALTQYDKVDARCRLRGLKCCSSYKFQQGNDVGKFHMMFPGLQMDDPASRNYLAEVPLSNNLNP